VADFPGFLPFVPVPGYSDICSRQQQQHLQCPGLMLPEPVQICGRQSFS